MRFVAAISLASAVAFVASSCTGPDKIDAERAAPTATVYAERCRFTFPIENIQRTWKWGASKRDMCDYSWMVTIKADSSDYQLGFSYFNAGVGVCSGTFAQLLQVGQTDLWLLKEGGLGASRVEGVRVDASVEDNRLVFDICGKKWTERLFEQKPNDVTFGTGGSQLPLTSRTCRVVYGISER